MITSEHMTTNGSRKGTFNNLACSGWHALMFWNPYFQMPKGFASIGTVKVTFKAIGGLKNNP